MRHPFDGIVVPPTQPAQEPAPPKLTERRSLLKGLLAAAAGLFGLHAAARAGGLAIQQTTTALNEEGKRIPPGLEDQVTTLALGEEGGDRLTTAVKQEEGGTTTQAYAEEGGISTCAKGEEGGGRPIYTTRAAHEEGGQLTSLAMFEEGGRLPTEALFEEGRRPPVMTQADIPSEGGGPGRLWRGAGR
jgi:hypothetical protein